jgi:hypothetical protein
MQGLSYLAEEALASQEGLFYMEAAYILETK